MIEEEKIEKELSGRIPLYCLSSKFLLIEELALIEHFQELHYGRCCIIGKTAVDSEDPCKYFIENIRLPSLPQQYSLPEGSVRLRIITSNLQRSITHGKVCELIGEAILYDTIDPSNNKIPLTSKDVAEKVEYLRLNNLCVDEYKKNLFNRYIPAIRIEHIRPIERAAELAERNLEIRMICEGNERI